MATQPSVGDTAWDEKLNAYLDISHDSDGTIKSGSCGQSSQATGTSDISNSTGNWADMTDMSIEITTIGGNVLLMFSASIRPGTSGTNNQTDVRFARGTTYYHQMRLKCADADEEIPVSIQYLVESLAAGTYTFKVQWRDAAGDCQQYGSGTGPRVFTVIEQPV